MWIRNQDRNNQRVLDEVEIDGVLWVEIQNKKGGKSVFAKDRRRPSPEAVFAQDVLCELGSKQAYDRNG